MTQGVAWTWQMLLNERKTYKHKLATCCIWSCMSWRAKTRFIVLCPASFIHTTTIFLLDRFIAPPELPLTEDRSSHAAWCLQSYVTFISLFLHLLMHHNSSLSDVCIYCWIAKRFSQRRFRIISFDQWISLFSTAVLWRGSVSLFLCRLGQTCTLQSLPR